MGSTKSLELLQKAVTTDKSYIDACLIKNVCVICINKKTQSSKNISFQNLYNNNNQFWLHNKSWEYYLTSDALADIEKRAAELNYRREYPVTTETGAVTAGLANDTAEQDFGKEYSGFAVMSDNERICHLKECKNRLDALNFQKPGQEQLVTGALVETTRDAVLNNYTSLMNIMNLTGDEAKKQTNDLVANTNDLVKMSSQLISANIFNDDLINTLVSKSNGTTIQHMTRVYLKGLAFLSWYNKLVSETSIINKLRILFNTKYRDYYRSLLPHIHLENITLEKVFLGGMRAIPENTFYKWAVGFLLHDIGKAASIEYHEGEAAYNRDIVVEHIKIGYTSIMNKTNYPREASLIAGYHHEYYGDPSGYGYFRGYFEQYRKMCPQRVLNSCITYEIKPMMDCEALAFFPAKILEIVDVFDSLTDPNRKYRKAMTTKEALVMMREDLVNKHHKIDKILFDLFIKFITESASA